MKWNSQLASGSGGYSYGMTIMESRETGSMQWGTDGKNYYLLGASEKLYIEGAKDLIVIKNVGIQGKRGDRFQGS